MQVQSILQPAQDGAAAECFRLVLTGSGSSINSMLRQMKQPLLLLWGVRPDPVPRSSAPACRVLDACTKRTSCTVIEHRRQVLRINNYLHHTRTRVLGRASCPFCPGSSFCDKTSPAPRPLTRHAWLLVSDRTEIPGSGPAQQTA